MDLRRGFGNRWVFACGFDDAVDTLLGFEKVWYLIAR